MKWLLPVLWTSFFGGLALIVLIAFPFDNTGPIRPWMVKILTTSFFLSSLGVIFLLYGRIKRVDFGDTHFYVSNYFQTYRYTYDSILKMELRKGLFSRPVVVHFHERSSFGQQITFLASHRLEEFLREFPEIAEQIIVEEPS